MTTDVITSWESVADEARNAMIAAAPGALVSPAGFEAYRAGAAALLDALEKMVAAARAANDPELLVRAEFVAADRTSWAAEYSRSLLGAS